MQQPSGAATKVASVAELRKLRNEAAAAPASQQQADGATRVVSLAEIDKIRAQSASPAQEEGDWFVLIGGKQQGPLAVPSIAAMLNRNEIDKRTYVWRDGMDDWKRLGTVEEFQEQAGRAGDAAWRVMAPLADEEVTAVEQESGFSESTVAMNVSELQAQLAKATPTDPETAPSADEVAATPFSSAVTGGGDPFLIDALAGAPTGERLSRIPSSPGTDSVLGAPDLFAERESSEEMAAQIAQELTGLPEAVEEPVDSPLSELGPSFSEVFPDGAGANSDPSRPADAAYFNAPPGESTRVFMATAGLYKRRRAHRIAAVGGIFLSVLLVGVVSLDILGLIEIPGMGMVYDMTGLIDPNTDRATDRVENQLMDPDLTEADRRALQTTRCKLLGDTSPECMKKKPATATSRTTERRTEVKAGQGIKEEKTLTESQRGLASEIFASSEKKETKIGLTAPDKIMAPNLPEGLTAKTIYKVITDNNSSMTLCLNQSMSKGEKLRGRMDIEMTIAPNGSVPDVQVSPRTFQGTVMATCTSRAVKRWRFPAFNGKPVTVSYPYLLQMGF